MVMVMAVAMTMAPARVACCYRTESNEINLLVHEPRFGSVLLEWNSRAAQSSRTGLSEHYPVEGEIRRAISSIRGERQFDNFSCCLLACFVVCASN